MFIAVVDWTPENRIAKYQSFETERDATAHIDKVKRGFVAPHPGGGFSDWLIDPQARALSHSPDLAAIRAEKTQNIKDEAKWRILREYPDWKQRNMTALGTVLLRKMHDGVVLTANEQAEVTKLDAIWDWISAVRTASNTLEDSLSAMTATELRALIPTDDAHWPSALAPVAPRRKR